MPLITTLLLPDLDQVPFQHNRQGLQEALPRPPQMIRSSPPMHPPAESCWENASGRMMERVKGLPVVPGRRITLLSRKICLVLWVGSYYLSKRSFQDSGKVSNPLPDETYPSS